MKRPRIADAFKRWFWSPSVQAAIDERMLHEPWPSGLGDCLDLAYRAGFKEGISHSARSAATAIIRRGEEA